MYYIVYMIYYEKSVQKLGEEKKVLLKWFEANYKEYSEDKTRRLKELEDEISEKEKRWMELEAEKNLQETTNSI